MLTNNYLVLEPSGLLIFSLTEVKKSYTKDFFNKSILIESVEKLIFFISSLFRNFFLIKMPLLSNSKINTLFVSKVLLPRLINLDDEVFLSI